MRGRSLGPASFAAALLSACATPHPRPEAARRESPPTAPTPAAPALPFSCHGRDREWEAWFGDVFGRGLEVANDGPDPAKLRALTGQRRIEAERMLRRGLDACDSYAADLVKGAEVRALVPELTRMVDARNDTFRISVVLALNALDAKNDYAPALISTLQCRSPDVRMRAAIGSRRFPFEKVKAPLLERVRRDSSFFVRTHAAKSLLVLADIYPRDIESHGEIFRALVGPQSAILPSLVLGSLAPKDEVDADLLAQFSRAGDMLEVLMKERLAAGTCSPIIRPSRVIAYFVRMNSHVLGVAVEETISSCQRELAFVLFVESAGGFVHPGAGLSGRDPLRLELQTSTGKVPVTFQRTVRSLTVGDVSLDLSKANVAVLSSSAQGLVDRYRGSEQLTFQRDPSPAGRAVASGDLGGFSFAASTEVAAELRQLIQRSQKLSALVTPDPAP